MSYTPETGGKRVEDHKWVIQEELKGAGDKTLKPGDKAVIEASHMKGMKGAEAVIDSAKRQPFIWSTIHRLTAAKK